MGFYKNAGGIKEYTKENIEDTDIPLDTFIIFKESESHSGVVLKCIERGDKNTCKDCFSSFVDFNILWLYLGCRLAN